MGGTKQKKKYNSVQIISIVLALVMMLGVLLPVFGQFLQVQAQTVAVEVKQGAEESVSPEKAPKEITGNGLDVHAEIGFDQKYLVEHATPFQITVENTGAAFEGEVQLKIYDYLGDEYSSAEYSIYYQPIRLAAGAVKQVEMVVDVSVVRSLFTVQLVDNSETVVASKNFAATALDPSTVLVGVLTEQTRDLTYLTNMKLAVAEESYSLVNYDAACFLNGDNFPDSAEVMNNFKLLIINNFDTKLLSDTQKGTLANWLKAGGMLVLGTGPNAAKVLGGLSDILPCQLGEGWYLNDFSGLGLGSAGSGNAFCQEIVSDALNPLQVVEGEAVAWFGKQGQGHLIVHAMDLSLAPYATADGVEAYLADLYSLENRSKFRVMYEDSYPYNYMMDVAQNMQPLDMTRVYITFGILAAYVLLVGPVLYFVLKKKDKREKGWILIPAIAIFATVLIYGISLGSDYRKGIVNTVTITDLTGGGAAGATEVTGVVASPKKGDISISLGEGKNIFPSESRNGYYNRRNNVNPAQEMCKGKILSQGIGATNLTYFDNNSWAANGFTGSFVTDIGGTLDAEIVLQGNELIATMTNHSDFDFTDLLFLLGSEYIRFDSVQAGESKTFTYILGSGLQNQSRYNGYEMLRNAFGYSSNYDLQQMVRRGELTRLRMYEIYQRVNMIGNLTDYNERTDMTGVVPITMYAFHTGDLVAQDATINGKPSVSTGQNVFRFRYSLNIGEMETFDLPGGLLQPTAIWGETVGSAGRDGSNLYFQEADTYYMTFGFGYTDLLDLFQLTFPPNGYIPTNAQILNVETQIWEPLSEQEYHNPQAYFNEGYMTIRFDIAESYVDVGVPQLRLKGGQN